MEFCSCSFDLKHPEDNEQMNCILRFQHPLPSPETRWTFSIQDCSGITLFSADRLDSPKGWETGFRLQMLTASGDIQMVDVRESTESSVQMILRLYVPLYVRPSRETWKIPQNIFQTWKDGPKTPEMELALCSFRNQKGYKHNCLTDEQCYTFLKTELGERFSNAYKVLVPGAYRADFWRYCILYKYGGVYADAKTTLFRNLDEILRPQDELVLVRDIPSQCLLNGFIACKPAHPLIGIALAMTLERIEKRDYGVDPLDITGPHIFGRAFCRWKGHDEDTMTLTPGYTSTMQILGRSEDGLYIVSPEGERLMQKDYPTYYKNDMDVRIHYPQLWAARAVFADAPPWTQLKTE
jgi:hypothetical protein